MLEFLMVVLFCWLFFKAMGLMLRMAWCTAKVVASFLFVIAVPLMVACLIFAGGMFLLLPLALIGIAFGVAKACV